LLGVIATFGYYQHEINRMRKETKKDTIARALELLKKTFKIKRLQQRNSARNNKKYIYIYLLYSDLNLFACSKQIK